MVNALNIFQASAQDTVLGQQEEEVEEVIIVRNYTAKLNKEVKT